jgi:hypothetical protein
MTDNQPTRVPVDSSDPDRMKCLKCSAPNALLSAADDDDKGPKVDDITMCTTCAHFMAFTDNSVRECTDKEREKIARDPELQLFMSAIGLLGSLKAATDGASLRTAMVEVEVDPETGAHRIVGGAEGMPDDIRETFERMLADKAREAETEEHAQNILRLVTPEVASHVLAVAGHDDASWPPLSVAALITLVKQAMESDDEMTHHLKQVEYFQAYGLAVTMEQTGGAEILREIAGLPPLTEAPQQ